MGTSKPLPPIAKKLLVWLGIVGPACAAITTISVTIIDIRSKAQEAKARASAGYETLAPAIDELQGLSVEAQAWVEDAHRRIHSLERDRRDLLKRVTRLEIYVEDLGKTRSNPRPPDPVAKEVEPTAELLPEPQIKKPARLVPQDIYKAKTFQQQRNSLDCRASDPLCGQTK